MSGLGAVDAEALREEVREKYREVATNPHGTFHFHTGLLATRLGYDAAVVDALPDAAVEIVRWGCKPIVASTVAQGRACRRCGIRGRF